MTEEQKRAANEKAKASKGANKLAKQATPVKRDEEGTRTVLLGTHNK
jgi:hypothetical protein